MIKAQLQLNCFKMMVTINQLQNKINVICICWRLETHIMLVKSTPQVLFPSYIETEAINGSWWVKVEKLWWVLGTRPTETRLCAQTLQVNIQQSRGLWTDSPGWLSQIHHKDKCHGNKIAGFKSKLKSITCPNLQEQSRVRMLLLLLLLLRE